MFEDIVARLTGDRRFPGSTEEGEQARSGVVETDGGRLADPERSQQSLREWYDPDLDALANAYGDSGRASVGDRHVVDPFEPDDIADLVREYRGAGISMAEFADTQRIVADGLVDAAFDRLAAELDESAEDELERTRRDLKSGLGTATDTFSAGIEAYERDSATTASNLDDLDFHQVLHHIGTPLFVLDADGNVLTWNSQLAELTGVEEAEAQEMEMASMAFYPDGRRAKTLADKVIDAPERAHEEYDVPKVEDASFTLYRDTSVMLDQYGEEKHISFSAAPIYGDDGELIAVVEMVQDRTEDALRHQHTEDLVTELEETMRAIQGGDLHARAEFSNEEGYVEESLLDVVDVLNEMANTLEDLIQRVDDNANELAAATDQSADAAVDIEERIVEQNELLSEAAEDVQDVSASMEEIAATSSQVASAASRAREAVDQGETASEEAQAVAEELTETSAELVESVAGFEERMDEVNEIIEVIADVADQTNILALNANIEAARAGESGEGFAVVADEVKSLANETSEYADQIAGNVEQIQEQATETIDTVEESSEQIERAEAKIMEALDAFDDIADAVDETASGIQEVADANDSQADAIETVTTTIEEAMDYADEAEAAAEQIVEATESQRRSVDELVDSVEELSGESR